MDQKILHYRKAQDTDLAAIWQIVASAIERRGKDGSEQWQNGYPNEKTIQEDLNAGYGYVWEIAGEVAAYAAIIFDAEPAYEEIADAWQKSDPYAVVHRVAVSGKQLGKGVATLVFNDIEEIVNAHGINSIRVDTNFDNAAMLHIFQKCGYQYRGKVYFRGSERLAYEKEIAKSR